MMLAEIEQGLAAAIYEVAKAPYLDDEPHADPLLLPRRAAGVCMSGSK